MKKKTRPCWVVLAPGGIEAVKREVRAALRARFRAEEDDDMPVQWLVEAGSGPYCAVLEFNPGSECSGDEELAQRLSQRFAGPTYVLWLAEDMERVQVFEAGEWQGDAKVWPDALAAHLGCRFPRMDATASLVDAESLVPRKVPEAAKGERKLGRLTVAQWKHMIEHDSSSVSLMLGFEPEATMAVVLTTLSDPSADARAVAARLASLFSMSELGERFAPTLAKLEQMAASDPDESVREAAREGHAYLHEWLE